jgi:hypothetical protein
MVGVDASFCGRATGRGAFCPPSELPTLSHGAQYGGPGARLSWSWGLGAAAGLLAPTAALLSSRLSPLLKPPHSHTGAGQEGHAAAEAAAAAAATTAWRRGRPDHSPAGVAAAAAAVAAGRWRRWRKFGQALAGAFCCCCPSSCSYLCSCDFEGWLAGALPGLVFRSGVAAALSLVGLAASSRARAGQVRQEATVTGQARELPGLTGRCPSRL